MSATWRPRLEPSSMPCQAIRPESGRSSPARHMSVVVLPAPLGPRSARTCRGATLNSRLSMATVRPKRLVRPATVRPCASGAVNGAAASAMERERSANASPARSYSRSMRGAKPSLRKVPEITFHFWGVKILGTAMGEATSDYLVHTIDPFQADGLGFLGFVIAMAWQVAMRRYFAPAYWLAVTMVAVFGTMVADVIHIEFGVAYAVSAFDCAVTLAAIFAIWYLVERNLSIHSITTRRRELFYWAAVLATFAMGTALGDLSAYSWHLGFFTSGLLYTVLFGLPLLARRTVGLGELVAFWWAYIVTRPL